jgi:hypothetical protein
MEELAGELARVGTGKLDALRDLFNGDDWIPPALEPAA